MKQSEEDATFNEENCGPDGEGNKISVKCFRRMVSFAR